VFAYFDQKKFRIFEEKTNKEGCNIALHLTTMVAFMGNVTEDGFPSFLSFFFLSQLKKVCHVKAQNLI